MPSFLLRALCLMALGLLAYGPVAAQTTAVVAPLPPEGVFPDTLRNTLNRIFANLDKAQVPPIAKPNGIKSKN